MIRKGAGNLLIVDDKTSVLNSLQLFLKHHFKIVDTLRNPNQLERQIEKFDYDVILLDLNFTAGQSSGNEGIFWLRKIHNYDPTISVVMFTAYGDINLAVNAIKAGAIDFVVKPWDNDKILATLQAALKYKQSQEQIKKLDQSHKELRKDIDKDYLEIVGQSSAIRKLMTTIQKVAQTNASILLCGENGTGKELFAREIHRHSDRANKIFASVDVGALSESLFESELFGHVKGAFTDAKEERIGRFEMASGGTLFLDEIGNLSVNLQAKLLTAIEKRTINPVGSNKNVAIDVRLISATNKDLKRMVDEGLFREDLLYRINTIQLDIPPLHEREADPIQLTYHFLKLYSTKYEKPLLKINESALKKIGEYRWPGNIRELMHAVEKAVILCDSDVLKPEDFNLEKEDISMSSASGPISLEEGEKQIIENSLMRNNWNISDTARELKIGRQTLYRKIERYGI